jgi:thiosulfate/3-mercaptopyruvate sulfurtransferase
MMPTPEAFAAAVGPLGLSVDEQIVVYDTTGLFSAARVWWMLKTMGATRVQVLDGGLPRWRDDGLPTVSGPSVADAKDFYANMAPDAVASLDDVRAALAQDAQVVDARAAPRFAGAGARTSRRCSQRPYARRAEPALPLRDRRGRHDF